MSYAFSFSSRKNLKGPQNDNFLENLLDFVANHGFFSARLNLVCVCVFCWEKTVFGSFWLIKFYQSEQNLVEIVEDDDFIISKTKISLMVFNQEVLLTRKWFSGRSCI